jgi:hypothetical protein
MGGNFRAGAPWARSRVLVALALIMPLVLGLSACETLRVGSDYDRTASFSGFHSFTWVRADDVGMHNPLVAERAREAIKARLERMGYTYVSEADQADFAVDFTIGSRERVDVQTYPAAYAGAWWGYGRGWWGYPYWGTGVDVQRYREGELAIDVFDARTHKPVWHGWAKKPLTEADMEHSSGTIREAADAILARFPPA